MPVNISESKEHIRDFLNKYAVAVLATSDSSGTPHAAAIYYVIDDDLNLYFVTKTDTTKYKNLQNNSKAAIVVYEPSSQTTVQAQGLVIEETDASRFHEVYINVLKRSMATSDAGIPPIEKLDAGSMVAYRLESSSIKMASFARPDGGTYEKIFEII